MFREISMGLNIRTSLVVAGLLSSLGLPAAAVSVTSIDLDGLNLGATIVGPVGPTVDTTLTNTSGEGVGDLISSVSCPSGFTVCAPPNNPAGTIYTYRHQVTPGVDFPNDAPFPSPSTILPLTDVGTFRLNFSAEGFNGVAGYSFSDAANALNDGVEITTTQNNDGSIAWDLSDGSGWDTNESITFFWQTTQPPSGPGGSYGIANASQIGTAQGPLPIPVSLKL